MIIVADVNTIWRAKLFETLGAKVPVLGLRPHDPLAAWRQCQRASMDGMVGAGHPVLLPPSWASRTARVSQLLLWRRARVLAGGKKPQALVVTSPHYLPLVRRLAGTLPIFYYASDDYRSYDGWESMRMAEQEGEITHRAEHAFFVSHALANRAVREYGLPPGKVSVSMNATDERFLGAAGELPGRPPITTGNLTRPVVGVVGGVNGRLDWGLLKAVAQLPEVGTLLFIGPVAPYLINDEAFLHVRQHRKSVFVGARPHKELPSWMRALDVALIPYAPSSINHFCSPMRLFDHLAAGRPIVATNASDQVQRFVDWVKCADNSDFFLEQVGFWCVAKVSTREAQVRAASRHLWPRRAEALAHTMGSALQRAAETTTKASRMTEVGRSKLP